MTENIDNSILAFSSKMVSSSNFIYGRLKQERYISTACINSTEHKVSFSHFFDFTRNDKGGNIVVKTITPANQRFG